MNIQEFKKGEIITRTEPSLAIFGGGINFMGVETAPKGDRSYMGDKLQFVGIANGQIYFKSLKPIYITIFGQDKIFDLPLDTFSEGWEYYIDPETLLQDNTPIPQMSKQQLEKALKDALDKEDFEKAAELRDKLNKL